MDEAKGTATRQAGRLLLDAAVTGRPVDPVRNQLGAEDTGLAYAVQEWITRQRVGEGGRVVGRKVGLTSPAVQQQLGVGQPDFGVLFDDMSRTETDPIDMGRLIAPRIEAEVAFVLAADLVGDDLDLDRVHDRVDCAVPALEIVDSRVRGWDISIVDTIADNASSALFVLGEKRSDISGIDLSAVTMEMSGNGTVVSSGTGRACLGNPLNAVLWLARTCQDLGSPLRAGEVVLSGALGPMVSVEPGTTYHAVISELGSVTATFGPRGSTS